MKSFAKSEFDSATVCPLQTGHMSSFEISDT